MRVLLCIGCVFGGPILLYNQWSAGTLTTETILWVGAFFVGGALGLLKSWRDMTAPRTGP